MLPLECHSVAEIRYQEHVDAARSRRRGGAPSPAWLARLVFARPSLAALRQDQRPGHVLRFDAEAER